MAHAIMFFVLGAPLAIYIVYLLDRLLGARSSRLAQTPQLVNANDDRPEGPFPTPAAVARILALPG